MLQHSLLTHTHTHTQALKDWVLALAVGVLILIDISILLTYTTVEGYRGNLIAIRVPNRENMRDVDGVSVRIIELVKGYRFIMGIPIPS